jgi:chromosome segregation ATPase
MTKPVREHDHSTPYIETERQGALGTHKVINKTGEETSHADMVPTTNFKNPEGSTELSWHTITTALKTRGFLYTLDLILAYLFPSTFSKPSLPPSSWEAENMGWETKLKDFANRDKNINDREVQAILKSVFGRVDKLNTEWKTIRDKEGDKKNFLKRFEDLHAQINTIEDDIPFTKEKKADALQRLETIKDEALKKVLNSQVEILKKEFDSVKESKTQNPEQIFKYYNRLEATLSTLENYETSDINVLKTEKETQLQQLKALQTDVKNEYSKTKQEAQEALLTSLPLDKLKTMTRKSALSKNNFSESVNAFKSELDHQYQAAETEVTDLDQTIQGRKATIKGLENVTKQEAEKLKQAEAVKIAPLREGQQAIEERLKHLALIKAGEVKKNIFFTEEFTENHQKEMDRLTQELDAIASKLENLESIPELKTKLEKQLNEINMKKTELAQKQTDYDNARQRKDAIKTREAELENLVAGVAKQPEFTNYVRISLLEKAFQAYQQKPLNERPDGTTFINSFPREQVIPGLKDELGSMLGSVPETLLREMQSVAILS